MDTDQRDSGGKITEIIGEAKSARRFEPRDLPELAPPSGERAAGQTEAPSELFRDAFNEFAQAVHDSHVKSGFWLNTQTMESFDPYDNLVFGLKLALVHGELSEALEGVRKGLMDDKLPHRPAGEVELADAVIRIMDLAQSRGYDLGGAIVEKDSYNRGRQDHKLENRLKSGGKAF